MECADDGYRLQMDHHGPSLRTQRKCSAACLMQESNSYWGFMVEAAIESVDGWKSVEMLHSEVLSVLRFVLSEDAKIS